MFIEIANAAEQAEAVVTESGILSSLGLDPMLFISQLINFIVVGFILWFLILKPLTNKIGERQKIVEQSMENAKKIADNLAKSEQKYQEKIDQSKIEAIKIIEQSQSDAVALGESMKQKARKEIELAIDQAKRNIKIEKEEMMINIKKEVANFIISATEKVLQNKIDQKYDQEIIEQAIKSTKYESEK